MAKLTPLACRNQACYVQRGDAGLIVCFAQVELRVMAALSGDEALLAAFANGQDVHAATARDVLGKGPQVGGGPLSGPYVVARAASGQSYKHFLPCALLISMLSFRKTAGQPSTDVVCDQPGVACRTLLLLKSAS